MLRPSSIFCLDVVIRTFAIALHLQSTSKPMRSNSSEQLSYRASDFSNPKGRFLDLLKNSRRKIRFHVYPRGPLILWLIVLLSEHFLICPETLYPPCPSDQFISPNQSTHSTQKLLPSGKCLLNQSHPFVHSTTLPWKNPRDSILLFVNNSSQSDPNIPSTAHQWQIAIVYNWPNSSIFDLGLLARDIPKAASLPFIPTLKPFGNGKALFFCKTFSQYDILTGLGPIISQALLSL